MQNSEVLLMVTTGAITFICLFAAFLISIYYATRAHYCAFLFQEALREIREELKILDQERYSQFKNRPDNELLNEEWKLIDETITFSRNLDSNQPDNNYGVINDNKPEKVNSNNYNIKNMSSLLLSSSSATTATTTIIERECLQDETINIIASSSSCDNISNIINIENNQNNFLIQKDDDLKVNNKNNHDEEEDEEVDNEITQIMERNNKLKMEKRKYKRFHILKKIERKM